MSDKHLFWHGLSKYDFLLLFSIGLNFAMVIVVRLIGSSMYPFFFAIYLWIATYAVFLALLLRRNRILKTPVINSRLTLSLSLLLVAAFRLVFLGQTQLISLDPLWYLDYGKFMIDNSLPYFDFFFPYPPVFAYFIFFISLTVPSIDAFRILAMLADIGVALLLWKIVKQDGDSLWASVVLLAYALLPLSIIESGWNGHFEPLTNLFMLLGLWFMFSQRAKFSGLSMGVATATKVYPGLLLPMMLFYFKGWKQKFGMLLSTVIGFGITCLPIFGLAFTRATTSRPIQSFEVVQSENAISFFVSNVLKFFTSTTFLTLIALTGIFAGIFLSIWHLVRNESKTSGYAFQWATLALGLTLVILGLVAGLYPLLPVSKLVYWRYPADIGVVRGITTVSLGIILMSKAGFALFRREKVLHDPIQLFFLVSGIILLFATLTRDVWYGWYLLWSIPLFLLVKNKSLVLTIILCLLFFYPSYTHDNFATLGFEENRFWNDELTSADAWSVFINTSNTVIDPSLISASVEIEQESVMFKFDTSKITDESQLQNISISYTKNVLFSFNNLTEFVTKIKAQWDPTFGACAALSLSYAGRDDTNESISGVIIPPTTIFTNLTHVLWRYAFSTNFPQKSGTIHNLTVIVYPFQSVASCYIIDFFYTTFVGPLNPLYFLTIPNFVALSLLAYVVLHEELKQPQVLMRSL